MPYKDPKVRQIKQAVYKKRHYEKNREAHIQRSAINKRKQKKIWDEFKASQKCSHCGVQHTAVIDFHHVIRDKDKRSVNKLVANGRFAAAMEEIQKCIPLCANCHRMLHWEETQKVKKKRLKKRKKCPKEDSAKAPSP
jgi:citrate lyase alpha subunit